MKSLLLLMILLSGVYTAEVDVESNLKVEYMKTFTRDEIIKAGYNPDITLCMKQTIIRLPTGERILYTTFQYVVYINNNLAVSRISDSVPSGSVYNATTTQIVTTATKLNDR